MTQYKTLNVKFFHSQLNKLKSGMKYDTEVTLKLSSNVIFDFNDKNNFPHKLLLTNTHISKLSKAFENSLSANIKLSKTQLHKTEQSGGFLGRHLGPLLKTELPSVGNVPKPLAKSVLIPLGLTAASLAADAAIHEKMFGYGLPSNFAPHNTTLIISTEEMNDIIKIIKSLEKSGLLTKVVAKQLKIKQKKKKEDFLECY